MHVVTYRERLTSENIDRMLEGVDVIVDGTDNFPTRYLLNDASLRHRIPVVHASIYRFEGQLTVFKPYEGPCYRCLFPQPPPPELAPSCAEGGVLGVLPGIMGSLQANEALKLLLDIGEPPVGRLILFDALDTTLPRGAAAARSGLPRVRRATPARSSTSTTRSFASRLRGRQPDMASFRLPPVLRPMAGGARTVEAGGDSLRAALEDLTGQHPALRSRLLDDDGEINAFVNVYVEGEDVRVRGGLDTPLAADASVIVLPAMAGGSGAERMVAVSPPGIFSCRTVGDTPLVELLAALARAGRAPLREARVVQPDRLDQGPRGVLDARRRLGGRRALARAPHPRAVERQHRHRARDAGPHARLRGDDRDAGRARRPSASR